LALLPQRIPQRGAAVACAERAAPAGRARTYTVFPHAAIPVPSVTAMIAVAAPTAISFRIAPSPISQGACSGTCLFTTLDDHAT
jgi:hypothetical protein